MRCVIIVTDRSNPEEPKVFGPFDTEIEACTWAHKELDIAEYQDKVTWYWAPLVAPRYS